MHPSIVPDKTFVLFRPGVGEIIYKVQPEEGDPFVVAVETAGNEAALRAPLGHVFAATSRHIEAGKGRNALSKRMIEAVEYGVMPCPIANCSKCAQEAEALKLGASAPFRSFSHATRFRDEASYRRPNR